MALDDRPYWRGDSEGGYSAGGMGLRLGLPRPTPGVIGLIVACVVVFIVEGFFPLRAWLAMLPDSASLVDSR